MKGELSDVVKEYEKMVYKLAYNYSRYYNIDDLYQAGMIGLIKAYKKFDKSSSCKFSSYSYKYILGEMIDFIKKDRNIIVSDEIFSIYKKYLKVKELLSTKYERDISIKEISAFMEIEESLWNYYSTYINKRFTKSTTDEIVGTLSNMNKELKNSGIKLNLDDESCHQSIDLIYNNLVKKYSTWQNVEEIISVFYK